jgi:hypothetical protein
MIQDQEVLNLLRYCAAFLIVVGGLMHLIGLITALVRRKSLPWVCWFVFFFAIVMYPASAVMILKNIPWGYWITAGAPCAGGLLIFLGFFFPKWGFLKLLAGNFDKEITWMGFVQISSESMAVGYALLLIYHKVWLLSGAG